MIKMIGKFILVFIFVATGFYVLEPVVGALKQIVGGILIAIAGLIIAMGD